MPSEAMKSESPIAVSRVWLRISKELPTIISPGLKIKAKGTRRAGSPITKARSPVFQKFALAMVAPAYAANATGGVTIAAIAE